MFTSNSAPGGRGDQHVPVKLNFRLEHRCTCFEFLIVSAAGFCHSASCFLHLRLLDSLQRKQSLELLQRAFALGLHCAQRLHAGFDRTEVGERIVWVELAVVEALQQTT